MKLTEEQSRELFRRTGNYLKESCDGCGKPLAEVRYTRCGEPGEWCSELCRDGVKAERKRRRGGRPRKYRSEREQREAHAVQQRDYRERRGVTKTLSQPNGTKGVADAVFAFKPYPTKKAISAVLEGLR
jgi:hypothetical protein